MQHGERLDRAAALVRIVKPCAPCPHNPSLDAQQRANCRCPEANQELRIGKVDLPLNERQTCLRLLGRRGSIARRPPRNDISDVDLLSIETDCAQHAIKQLPRSSDKWAPDSIFLPSRCLANKHDPCARNAIREYQLRGGPLQRAPIEISHNRPQRLQIRRSFGERANRTFCGIGQSAPICVLRRSRSGRRR
jgi:hypothetical protein